jgi:hypothetical protein
MKMPLSAVFKMRDLQFKGLCHPKHFLVLTLVSKSQDVLIERYVRSFPFLLRVRLMLAKLSAIRAYKKMEKFKEHNGL